MYLHDGRNVKGINELIKSVMKELTKYLKSTLVQDPK